MASYLYSFVKQPQKDNSRLDPLTTLIKLSLLPYKPEGTKLSIDSNYIYYSENTVFQFAVRKYFGDSYNDLRDLNKTLHKAVAWYYDDSKLKYLFESAVIGLEKLKKTYGNTGKADAVQSYIDILSGFNYRVLNDINKEKEKIKNRNDNRNKLENKSNEKDKLENRSNEKDKLENKSNEKDKLENRSNEKDKLENRSNEKDKLENRSEDSELKLHDVLKNVWSDDDKEIILRFFYKIKIATNEEDINDTINGIEALLLSIHKKIEKEVKILSSI